MRVKKHLFKFDLILVFNNLILYNYRQIIFRKMLTSINKYSKSLILGLINFINKK
jgi:hypothetical protein